MVRSLSRCGDVAATFSTRSLVHWDHATERGM